MTSTGATLLSNSGANLNIVKQLGGWKSSSVAEGYIENSTLSKQKIFLGITNENNEPIAHCSKNNPYTLSTANEKQKARNKHNEDESSKTKKMNSHHKQPLTYSKNKNSNSVKIDSKAISNPNSAKSMPIETDSTPKSATSNANLVISTPIPATSIPNPSAAKDSASSTKRKLNLSDDDDFGNLSIIAHNSADSMNNQPQKYLNGLHTLKLKRCKINQLIIVQRSSDWEKIIKKNKFASSIFNED
uniref:Tyr recombinase domain-containing protein n=1 Tax=Trichogramma kaykai TaxID=54128 RepID=A0ABD2XJN4_9HYME